MVTDISGTFNGFSVTELPLFAFAHNDNLLFSTGALVDHRGLSFQANGADFNLFSLRFPGPPPFHPASSPLGVCFVASCSSTAGFFPLSTLNGVPVAPAVPEPGTIALLGTALAGLLAARPRHHTFGLLAGGALPTRPVPRRTRKAPSG